MNLWNLFPDFLHDLLGMKVLLALPWLAVVFYGVCAYCLVTQRSHRVWLALFGLLSFVASATMSVSMGPRIGLIIPPLLLWSVMIMPLFVCLYQLRLKSRAGIVIWSIATVAGWLHSLAWFMWLLALAGS